MKTKLEELKTAYAEANPAPYLVTMDEPCQITKDANFCALAHRLMPQLFEAVEVLKQIRDYSSPCIEDKAEVRWELANDYFERILK